MKALWSNLIRCLVSPQKYHFHLPNKKKKKKKIFCFPISFLPSQIPSLHFSMDPTAAAAVMPIDLPIIHESDRYDFVRDIGSGNFGVARLMTDRLTQELVAVKYIERGDKVRSFFFQIHSIILYDSFDLILSLSLYLYINEREGC